MTPMPLRPSMAPSVRAGVRARVALVAGLLAVGAAVLGAGPVGAVTHLVGQSTSPSATAAVPTAPPTTAEAQQRGTIDDPAARTMRLVIWGLVALGVVIAFGTAAFWVRTRPPLVDPITVVPLADVTGRVERQAVPVSDVGATPDRHTAVVTLDTDRSKESVERWGETYAPLPSMVAPATADPVPGLTEEER